MILGSVKKSKGLPDGPNGLEMLGFCALRAGELAIQSLVVHGRESHGPVPLHPCRTSCNLVVCTCDTTAALVVCGEEKRKMARFSPKMLMSKKRCQRENERLLLRRFFVLFIDVPSIRLFSRVDLREITLHETGI